MLARILGILNVVATLKILLIAITLVSFPLSAYRRTSLRVAAQRTDIVILTSSYCRSLVFRYVRLSRCSSRSGEVGRSWSRARSGSGWCKIVYAWLGSSRSSAYFVVISTETMCKALETRRTGRSNRLARRGTSSSSTSGRWRNLSWSALLVGRLSLCACCRRA